MFVLQTVTRQTFISAISSSCKSGLQELPVPVLPLYGVNQPQYLLHLPSCDERRNADDCGRRKRRSACAPQAVLLWRFRAGLPGVGGGVPLVREPAWQEKDAQPARVHGAVPRF